MLTQVKRFFDILIAVMASLLLALPLLILALMIRRKLGAPVLFRQMRPGLRG